MPKTLLAVDDSATMRKVLEITFSGEDFHVVTAESQKDALSKMGDRPSAIVIDTVLGGDDGYALARELRKREPGAAIILLASRFNPYDAAKGKDSGADDFMDKPFDTQQMLDKVRKAMLAREGSGAAAPGPTAPSPGARAPAQNAGTPKTEKSARSQTLVFGDERATAPQPQTPERIQARMAPSEPREKQQAAAPVVQRERERAPDIAASVNGQLAGNLRDLGLSASQIDAVMALSRDVVERVVWEVVPQLAEALIKEEITRLTR